jgi:ANTAR domain/GAF domain
VPDGYSRPTAPTDIYFSEVEKTADPIRITEDDIVSIQYEEPAEDVTADVTRNLAESARVLFSSGDQGKILQHVVDLAVETIAHCQFAGIFILDGEKITTPVQTDPVVIEIDTLQHTTGEGPCLDAIKSRGLFYASDLMSDVRWPKFGSVAKEHGISSALAVTLSGDGTRGALNLYSGITDAFDATERANALLLAILADHALSGAQLRDEEERRVTNLQKSLVSREIIGQAQGILMERERITANEAFGILRKASQYLNLKLQDVAQTLVDTGERPETQSIGTTES